MGIYQSSMGKGIQQPPRVLSAGAMTIAVVKHTFAANFLTTDVLELAVLPAGARVVNMTLLPNTGATPNLTIGIMSGNATDPDAARTVGSEYFSAVTGNGGVAKMTAQSGYTVAPANADRGIGLTTSATINAAATVEVIIEYTVP